MEGAEQPVPVVPSHLILDRTEERQEAHCSRKVPGRLGQVSPSLSPSFSPRFLIDGDPEAWSAPLLLI